MDNKNFQHNLILQLLIFMLHILSFYVADAVFKCCMDRPMGDYPMVDVSIRRSSASGPTYFLRLHGITRTLTMHAHSPL